MRNTSKILLVSNSNLDFKNNAVRHRILVAKENLFNYAKSCKDDISSLTGLKYFRFIYFYQYLFPNGNFDKFKTQFSIHIFGFFLVCILSFHPSFAIQDSPVAKFQVDSLKQKEEKYWYADKTLDEMSNPAKKVNPKKPPANSGWSISPSVAALIGVIFKFLVWLILGAAVIGAIYLIYNNLRGYQYNANPKIVIKTDEILENEEPKDIENVDFEKQIANCLKNQNYRLATRYYYLWVVKNLDDANLIDFNIDKTNQDYVRELSQKTAFSTEKLSHFRKCTNYYEYLWFGNFEVSEPIFIKIESTFKEFINRKA